MFDENQIINFLKKQKDAISFIGMAKSLSIPRHKNKEFSSFLFSLTKVGKIFVNRDREFFIPKQVFSIVNTISLNQKGFGFVEDEEKEINIFIPYNVTLNAFSGDEVEVVYYQESEDKYQGIVKKIIARNKKFIVGKLFNYKDELNLEPLDHSLKNIIFKVKKTPQLKVDHIVKVKILKYGRFSEVEVIETLGHKDDLAMDINSLIAETGVLNTFSDNTNKEADKLPDQVLDGDTKGRYDLRNSLIVTIDGDDTKDFDDAIAVRKLSNGNWELGVHIADVTHYVKETTALDNEAKERGTSIYLADRVIPMLPTKLSNGICSLNPHVDRLTISMIAEIDKEGNNVKYEIKESVINSKHRLTYKEVNNFYEGKKSFENKELEKMLTEAKVLSDIIRKYKNHEGYVDFEIEEPKIIMDEKGKPIDIVVRERSYSEMMIEDFMVRANETIAYHTFKNELPFIYRIHDRPDGEKLTHLQNVLDTLDIKVKVPIKVTPKNFAKMLKQIKEIRFDDFLKLLMLRTMSKAIYSNNNVGHFGLASENYTHFTSPIRRYPDLMVHRMLREYIFKKNLKSASHFATILPSISKHSSDTEQVAVGLERKVTDMKKAEFFEQFIGQEFEGQIVSILKFGFFVEFKNKVDGLVHVSNLIDGQYKIDNTGLKLISKKNKFIVGQTIKVVVIGTNKSEGKIDLVLAKDYQEWKKMNNK